MLVTVVGQPQGPGLQGTAAARHIVLRSPARLGRTGDPPRTSDGAQAIDRSRAAPTTSPPMLAAHRRGAGLAARAPRRRRRCRCCGCRRSATISPTILGYADAAARRRHRHRLPRHRRLEPRRPDAGAACRPRRAGRRRPARPAAHPFHGQPRSATATATLLAAAAARRPAASSRSRNPAAPARR